MLDHAVALAEQELCIFPCKPRGKEPLLSRKQGGAGYKDATFDLNTVTRWWREHPTANIGLVPGRSGLIVIDVDGQDGEEQLSLLGISTVETLAVRSGRREGGRHLYFVHPGGKVGNRQLAPGLDVRCDHGYVIVPPSVHPSGAHYTWERCGTIAPLPEPVRTRLMGTRTVAEGGRNNALTSYLGGLRARGMELSELLDAARSFNSAQLDPPLDDQEVARVAASIAKYPAGASDLDEAVERMNRSYAVVQVSDKIRILQERADGFVLMPRDEFGAWLANEFVISARGRMPLSRAWFEHPRRRQYDRIVFEPGIEVPADQYNLWRGWGVIPKRGDVTPFLRHVREVIANGNEELARWVVGWFAQIFQEPRRKLGTALALRGKQGTGKSLLGNIVGRLLGPSHTPVATPHRVTGKFNAHLERCLLLQADEAFWAGDKTAEGTLKDLITGDFQWIERKGIDAFPVANYVRLLVTSNAGWVVPAGLEERRFAVLDVSDRYMQDQPYFRELVGWADSGGCEALLHHLLNEVDVDAADLRKVPATSALFEQKISSLSAEQAWWLDVLQCGLLPGFDAERGRIEKTRLYESYVQHAQKSGARRRSIETTIGIFLKQNVPGVESTYDFPDPESSRQVALYVLPALAECRAEFAKRLRMNVLWEEPSEWASSGPTYRDDVV